MIIQPVFSEQFLTMVHHLRSAPDIFSAPSRWEPAAIPKPHELTQRIRFLMERVPAGARVLDLGSGVGDVAFFLETNNQAQVLCIERKPEFISSCQEKGLCVISADLNNIDDPALRWVFSQRWDVVIAIDTMTYWQYPALILSVLSDRVGKIILTVPNAANIHKRINALMGKMESWPNSRLAPNSPLTFDVSSWSHGWTLQGFIRWAESLGYRCRLLGRRGSKARFRSAAFFPSLFARSFVFELTPTA